MSDVDSTDSASSEKSLRANIGEADDLTRDRAFDLLRNQQRRSVLETLHAIDETVMTTEELADRVLARDSDADDRDQVLTRLYHQTLPRLADDGVIDFDSRTDTVRYDGGELIDTLLSALAE